jgi:hypothetical protein
MRDRTASLLQILFHTGLPMLLVLILLVGNALLSQGSALMR